MGPDTRWGSGDPTTGSVFGDKEKRRKQFRGVSSVFSLHSALLSFGRGRVPLFFAVVESCRCRNQFCAQLQLASSASQPSFHCSVPSLVLVPGRDVRLYVTGGGTSQGKAPETRSRENIPFLCSYRLAALLSSQRDLSRSSPPPLPAFSLRPLSRSRPQQRALLRPHFRRLRRSRGHPPVLH